MIADLLRAIAQIGDPRFRRVFWRSILLTVGLLALFLFGWSWLVTLIPDAGLSIWGVELTALDWAAGAVAFLAGTVVAILLMPAVAAMFIGLYLEDVADAVEAKHYPHLPPAGRLTFVEMVTDGLVFAVALLLANLVGIVLYPFAGPLAPFVFVGVNGYVLGRQYFELAAGRRLGAKGARDLRRRAGLQLWLGGAIMAFGLTVPLINLAVPVLGVAAFTHTFQRVRAEP